ncbi:MAG: hypothetical protein IJ301_01500 [Clostridia bacterium]|nr:hypothetical protein [Clostridia bacterium]
MRKNVLTEDFVFETMQKNLSNENYAKLSKAILSFGFSRAEPDEGELDEGLRVAYDIITYLMARSQEVYDIKLANAKKGGRPKTNKTETEGEPTQNQDITETKPNDNQNETEIKPNDNQNITKDKPKRNLAKTKTEPNKTKTEPNPNPIETEIEYTYVNNNKNNIFFLSDYAGQKPKEYSPELRKKFLGENYEYHKGDEFGLSMLVIVDTLLEIQEFAQLNGEIKFNTRSYSATEIENLLNKFGKRVVDNLTFKIAKDKSIENIPAYVLGTLLQFN